MKRFILFSLPVFALSCGESNPTTPDGKPDGQALYEQNCSICHGSDGKMQASGSKDLSLSTMNLEERISIITNGRNGMAPFRDVLDEEQRKAVAEYLETLRK